jgi:hypothetical protein
MGGWYGFVVLTRCDPCWGARMGLCLAGNVGEASRVLVWLDPHPPAEVLFQSAPPALTDSTVALFSLAASGGVRSAGQLRIGAC